MKKLYAFLSGALIGILGGLMGLGGAEYRLPLLVGYFRFELIQAIIINLLVSMFTVLLSLIFRNAEIPFSELIQHYESILNLLAGSAIGAWIGVRIAIKVSSPVLTILVWISLMSLGIFMILHALIDFAPPILSTPVRILAGFIAGIIIGMFSSMLGVAGGELIIPTLILLYAQDIKLAGSISLCISLPTIIIGLYKYRKDKAFAILKTNKVFILLMTTGSIAGALVGSRVLGGINGYILQMILGVILIITAIKTFWDKK